jgi:leader peptidase (prepilin peptidase)/N-methyltransferase
MSVESVSAAVVAGLAGGFIVGPRVADAVQRWIGWRVVLPLLFGFVAPRSALGPTRRAVGEAFRSMTRAIQITTATVFALIGLRFGWTVLLVPVLALATGLVATSAVDLVCWRIPTRFVYLTGLAVVAGLVLASVVVDEPSALVGAVIGAGLYLLLLGGMHLASPRMLGFGDVRLGTLTGLVVGWMGWRPDRTIDGPLSAVTLAILVASLAGTLAGVVVLVLRRRAQGLTDKPWREPYPFGPWLCVGGLVAILAAAPGPG